MKGLFAKKVDPVEQAKQWKRNISHEIRGIERTIRDMEREEKKIMDEIKKLAKQGDSRKSAITILAKDLVRARKTKEKLINGKVTLNSVQMSIQMQISTIKVAGVMQRSTEVLSAMNSLVKIPELSKACQDMAREMEKAGLIDDLVADAMDAVDTTSDDEVNEEVDKVLAELTVNVMDSVPSQPTKKVEAPATSTTEEQQVSEQSQADAEAEELELKQMRERLNAL